MTVFSGQSLRRFQPVIPFCERTKYQGMTYGVGPAGYDIRIEQTLSLAPGAFKLASTIERFQMPAFMLGIVHDKSTWARMGLSVFNTVIEPGWEGFLTLELANHSDMHISIFSGTPIAQVIFHKTDEPVERPYDGKYQNQQAGPQPAKMEDR